MFSATQITMLLLSGFTYVRNSLSWASEYNLSPFTLFVCFCLLTFFAVKILRPIFSLPFCVLPLLRFVLHGFTSRAGLLAARQVTSLMTRQNLLLPGSFGYQRPVTGLSKGREQLVDLLVMLLQAAQRRRLASFELLSRKVALRLQRSLPPAPALAIAPLTGPALKDNGADAAQCEAHNALMHALNGNIDAARPTGEQLAASIPELGGVRAVLTELPAASVSTSFNKSWAPALFPRQLTMINRNYSGDSTLFKIVRESTFIRHFPKLKASPQLPETFTAAGNYVVAFKREVNAAFAHVRSCDFSRYFDIALPNLQPLQSRFEGLGPILNGALDSDSITAAERVLATNRFLDTRGNRQVVRWEAETWSRWLQLVNFNRATATTGSWLQTFYRLWARYLQAIIKAEYPVAPNCRVEFNVHAGPDSHGNSCDIVHINAILPPGPTPANPEDPMWTPAAQADLRSGYAQFIDAEGLSERELIEFISALAPLKESHVNTLTYHEPEVAHYESDTAAEAEASASAASKAKGKAPATRKVVDSPAKATDLLTGAARYAFDNGVNTIFVHHGNKPLPDQATQDRIRDSVNGAPDLQAIASLILSLVTKYALGSYAETAFEAVLSRTVTFKSSRCRGTRPNVVADGWINADGHADLFLPRAITAHTYVDAFRMPVTPSAYINDVLALRHSELLNTAALYAQARATSLNWACFSISMVGAQWNAGIGTSNNQFIRNHTDVWLRRYNSDPLNLWSSVHANAMAHQYGFSTPAAVRATEAGLVVNWWLDHIAPYIVNPYMDLWMMECIPSFQLLPYHSESGNSPAPQWPADLPRPAGDYLTFQGDVQVARDRPPFTGRTWVADGGSTRNAQFYVAQGDGDVFRYEGTAPSLNLSYWSSQFYHQFPQAPTNLSVTWMGDLNGPFADFILPGSVPTLNMPNNRVYAWGVHLTGSGSERNAVARRWYELSLGAGDLSLMVNYLSPMRGKREIESLADYSQFIWEDGNSFAGITLVRSDIDDIAGAAYLDRLRVPPLPRSSDLSSLGDPAQFHGGNRITKSKPKTSETPLQRVRAYRAQMDAPATLEYRPKVPIFKEDVPPMDTYVAEVRPEGVQVDTFTPLGGTTPDRLAQIEAKIAEVGRLQEAYLAEMTASLNMARQATSKGALQPRAPSRFSAPQPRTMRSPRTTNAVAVRVQPAQGKNIKPHAPVAPNDSASAVAQHGVAQVQAVPVRYDTEYPPLPQPSQPPFDDTHRINFINSQRRASMPQLTPAPAATNPPKTAHTQTAVAQQHLPNRPDQAAVLGEPIALGVPDSSAHASGTDGDRISESLSHAAMPGPVSTIDYVPEN